MSRRKLSRARRAAMIESVRNALTSAAAIESVACVASLVLTRGEDAEMFDSAPERDGEQLIAAVTAFAAHAPDGYLELMTEIAEREIAWTKAYVAGLQDASEAA